MKVCKLYDIYCVSNKHGELILVKHPKSDEKIWAGLYSKEVKDFDRFLKMYFLHSQLPLTYLKIFDYFLQVSKISLSSFQSSLGYLSVSISKQAIYISPNSLGKSDNDTKPAFVEMIIPIDAYPKIIKVLDREIPKFLQIGRYEMDRYYLFTQQEFIMFMMRYIFLKMNRPLTKLKRRLTEILDKKWIPIDDNCAICIESMRRDVRSNIVKLRCGHAFHCDCYSEMCTKSKKNDCPICRRNQDSQSEESDVYQSVRVELPNLFSNNMLSSFFIPQM